MNKAIKINHVSVIIAAIAAFVVSSVWYIIFGKILMELSGIDPATTANESMPAWKMLAEFGRSLVLAYVLSYFVSALDIINWKNALKFCLLIWIGFPVILLFGSVIHENENWKIAAIHAGDWFVKPLTMLLILSFWNRKKSIKEK